MHALRLVIDSAEKRLWYVCGDSPTQATLCCKIRGFALYLVTSCSACASRSTFPVLMPAMLHSRQERDWSMQCPLKMILGTQRTDVHLPTANTARGRDAKTASLYDRACRLVEVSPDASVAREVDVVVVREAVHLLGGDAREAEHADLHRTRPDPTSDLGGILVPVHRALGFAACRARNRTVAGLCANHPWSYLVRDVVPRQLRARRLQVVPQRVAHRNDPVRHALHAPSCRQRRIHHSKRSGKLRCCSSELERQHSTNSKRACLDRPE